MKALGKVSPERMRRAERIKGLADKRRCIASGILLNYMVKSFVEMDKNETFDKIKSRINNVDLRDAIEKYDKNYEYEVEILEGGKPVFVHHKEIKYNLSHAGDYVVCAVAGNEVGIDIEGNREINDRVSNRFFSEEERDWVKESSSEELKSERFFRLWTAKEAFAKVTGIGLARSIEKVHFKESECGILTICEADFVDKYGLLEYKVENYRITVAFLK